jgi:hypothetical protein
MGASVRFRVLQGRQPYPDHRSPVFIALRRVLRVLRVEKKVNENT